MNDLKENHHGQLVDDLEKGQCLKCHGTNATKCIEVKVAPFKELTELESGFGFESSRSKNINGTRCSDSYFLTKIQPKRKYDKNGKAKPVPSATPIYDPDDLNLERIESDPDIIRNCWLQDGQEGAVSR
ncbi:hypothetical protein C8J56DRAFT_891175 [Mycena floridula]|nr:hypothetical protein C8J56DRAFT_891175 [Mycena floridula]